MRTDARSWLVRGMVRLTLLMFAAQPAVAAATGMLTVRWDLNTTDPDVAGYRVYVSTDSGLFSLSPAQALPLTLTRVVGPGVTETIFTTLDPALVYWVGVTSLDTSANESVFSDIVSGQPRDGTAPAVAMTAPANGATVTGVVTIGAIASDDVGVVGVQFLIDGLDYGAELSGSPYTLLWDTTSVANGAHAVSARARDAAGNVALSSTPSVTVNNVTPGGCAPGTDPDNDGFCGLNDNCPSVFNPGQQNTDGDYEGGDACDITVLSPMNGSVLCSGPAPTIVWSPEIYDRFKVFVAADGNFNAKITSGKTPLTGTSWSIPVASWQTICAKSNPNLYIKVLGKLTGSKKKEYSEVDALRVK